MSKWKKFAAALAFAPAAVFAEGGGATSVSEAVTQLQTAATGAIDAVKPAVIAICVALFVIVGIVFAYRVIKARFGRG